MKRRIKTEKISTVIQQPVEKFFNVNKIHNPKEKQKILKIICSFFNSRGGRLIFNKVVDSEMPIPLLELPRKMENIINLIATKFSNSLHLVNIQFRPVQSGIESYLIIVDIKKSENVRFSYDGVNYIWDEEEEEPVEENDSEESTSIESKCKKSKGSAKEERPISRRKKSVKECPICHKKQKARRLCKECNWKLRNCIPISKVDRPQVIKRFLKESQDPQEEFVKRSQMKCFNCKISRVKAADCHYCAACYSTKAVRPNTRFAECHPNLKHHSLGLCIYCYKKDIRSRKRNSSQN